MKETYETKIEQLRKIIEKIEDGNTGLDESMNSMNRVQCW